MVAAWSALHRGIHHMRHTFIATLAERDVHERTAQHLAGHEDGRMTREIYTHVTRRMLDIATETITKAVGDIAGQASGSPSGSPLTPTRTAPRETLMRDRPSDLGIRVVEVMPLQTNTPLAVAGPKIELPQQQTATEKLRLSCRNAVLDAIDRLQQRTGATQFTRRDIVAEVQTTTTGFERQTIYRCIRRLSGHESGSPHHDLDDLGNNRLRLRP